MRKGWGGREEVEKREDGTNVLILQSVTLNEFIVDQQCRFLNYQYS